MTLLLLLRGGASEFSAAPAEQVQLDYHDGKPRKDWEAERLKAERLAAEKLGTLLREKWRKTSGEPDDEPAPLSKKQHRTIIQAVLDRKEQKDRERVKQLEATLARLEQDLIAQEALEREMEEEEELLLLAA